MTKVFLAAGVAALAISAPVTARPDAAERAQARESNQRVDRSAPRAQRAERTQRVDRSAQRAQRVERPARAERTAQRVERPARAERAERPTQRAERQQVRTQRVDRAQARVADRPARAERVQNRAVERQAVRNNRVDRVQANDRVQTRVADRQQQRIDRRGQVQDRMIARQDMRAQRQDVRVQNIGQRNQRFDRNDRGFANVGVRSLFEGCPPGLAARNNGCLPPGQARKLIGVPLSTAAGMMTLSALPNNVSYLYPETDDYYYRYGDGYAYRVDRGSNLISSLIPLLAGGYMPGQYLPNNYMNSYIPANYGFNSFYQDSPYQCNRYVNGIVYQVDCANGMIEDVVPLYAGGYGVGQMLPSTYYNLPDQYRGFYSDNDDYGYYYAPGAIYQYDQGSSMITSVAALLTPGFGIGQQMPMGYDTYNVPYAYRDTYFDTPNEMYRYNNGNIYQIDPTTQLVTAIVASILT